MSFLKPKTVVEDGDTVVVFLNVNSMHSVKASAMIENKKGNLVENIFQTAYGALKMRNVIGVSYGSRVELSKGWAYILQPNPELWTHTLPHRTQIIYPTDISMILFQLEIHPGSVIIESGTGSGSLSHYFIHAIKSSGHLHTFDFHEARASLARKEFEDHGLGNFVTVYHKDVSEEGFGSQLDGQADAVFLDLPTPRDVIKHVVGVFKTKGGRFGSFSPCIEQVQRCHEELRELGFMEILCMEILQQEHVVKTKIIPHINFDFVKSPKSRNNTKQDQDDFHIIENNGSTIATESTIQKRYIPVTSKVLTTVAPPSQPGHTGFLTFATFPPNLTR